MARCSAVHYGAVRCGAVRRCGAARRGTMRRDAVRCGAYMASTFASLPLHEPTSPPVPAKAISDQSLYTPIRNHTPQHFGDYVGMQGCGDAGMQGCRGAGMQACRDAGMQGCRDTGRAGSGDARM